MTTFLRHRLKPFLYSVDGERYASDVEQRNVQVFQSLRWFEAGTLQLLQQRKYVSDACEIDAVLARERLDRLQFHNVATRIAPPVGDRALGSDHVQVLVHH